MRTRGLTVAAASIGLTLLFWWPLVRGGGLVGGDTYRYFLPQKVVYAEHLARHELPLWNDVVGQGYPIVGESQTGVFYPPNFVLYSLLPVNTAYNVNFLAHYVMAFVFVWLYARAVGLTDWGSALAALVYTFGWFPPRSGLEWAILTGAWFPAALWCCERLLVTRQKRFAAALAIVLALQLLAGHFNLAFLTLITLIVYVPLRLFVANRELPAPSREHAKSLWLLTLAAMTGAVVLAAAQIGPSWELARLSQRVAEGPHHNLRSGAIPYWYLSQLVRPWFWYGLGTNRQEALDQTRSLGWETNPVEAHLFLGMVPLVLAVVWIAIAVRRRDRFSLIWAVLGLVALVYSTGWLVSIGAHVPGFRFFSAPGRYGLITTLAAGLLAGRALDWLRSSNPILLEAAVLLAFAGAMFTGLTLTDEAQSITQMNGTANPFTLGSAVLSDGFVSCVFLLGVVTVLLSWVGRFLGRGSTRELAIDCGRWAITACVFLAPTLEFWLVSRIVSDSDFVTDSPISHRHESPVGHLLAERKGTARLLSPGANLPSVLGAAVTPPYLTFAPAAYFNPALEMPAEPIAQQVAWLRRAGVTHVLSFEPADKAPWPARLVWSGIDPLLNPAWARYQEPLFVYELEGSRGRVAWEQPAANDRARIVEYQPTQITIEASSAAGGRLILTDLMYPDWLVSVDGSPAEPLTIEGQYRGVALAPGPHTVVWSYDPRVVYWSIAISAAAWLALVAGSFIMWRRSPAHLLKQTERR